MKTITKNATKTTKTNALSINEACLHQKALAYKIDGKNVVLSQAKIYANEKLSRVDTCKVSFAILDKLASIKKSENAKYEALDVVREFANENNLRCNSRSVKMNLAKKATERRAVLFPLVDALSEMKKKDFSYLKAFDYMTNEKKEVTKKKSAKK